MNPWIPVAFFMALEMGLGTAFAIPDAPHPDFDLKTLPFPEKYKTMGLAFLDDGRMVLATTEFVCCGEVPRAPSTSHKIFLVSGVTGANPNPQLTEISNNWLQIAGIVVGNGKLYVSDRDGFYEILQLSAPSDLKANRRLIVKWPDDGSWNSSGFQWHQWAFTPLYKQGFFYAPYSGSIRPGGPSDVNQTNAFSGAFLKWGPTGELEKYAGGLRSPNGASIDESTGDMMVADNQGSWLPSSTLMLMKEGRFYGHRNTSSKGTSANWAESLPYEPPVAWLPNGTLRTSPTQPIVLKAGVLAGHWLIGDAANRGLVRVAVDRVGDSPANGTAFWFSHGFGNAAIHRMAYGPDGALYIGTLTAIGNWPSGDKKDFYRLAPKAAASAFEMKTVRSVKDGLEVEFTGPVDPATAVPASFTSLKQWQYVRSEGYGAGKQPDQALTLSQVAVSGDRRRLYLKVAGLTKDRVVYLKATGVKGADGKAAWNDEAWFTHNTLATRVWDATTTRLAPMARASALESKVSHRIAGAGLSVVVDAMGPWQASLVSPSGAVVSSAAGAGPGGVMLPRGRAVGVHLLRVSSRDGVVVRKVVF